MSKHRDRTTGQPQSHNSLPVSQKKRHVIDVPLQITPKEAALANFLLAKQQKFLVEQAEQIDIANKKVNDLLYSVQVANLLMGHITSVALTANVAAENEKHRGEIIRRMLSVRIGDQDASAHLTGVFKQIFTDAEAISQEMKKSAEDEVFPINDAFDKAIQAVQTGRDQGDALLALQASHPAFMPFLELDKVIGKPGPESGPDPITSYILDETERLGKLHSLRTAGQELQKFIKDLSQLQEVRDWIAEKNEYFETSVTQRKERGMKVPDVYKYGEAVQAYERISRFRDRDEAGGEYLRKIRSKHKKQPKK